MTLQSPALPRPSAEPNGRSPTVSLTDLICMNRINQYRTGDGSSASGNVYTDTVNIGGVSITNQEVELAQKLSTEFASGAGDGLLGLAWPSINTVTPKPAETPGQSPKLSSSSHTDSTSSPKRHQRESHPPGRLHRPPGLLS